jgi:protein-disulfide isomerase
MAAPSANAARCAGDQGKYWEYHDALYAEQNALNAQGGTVQYTLDDLKAWGKKIGLNESQFNACVDDNTYASEIAANMAEGQTVGVGGTPSFVIGLRNETGQLVVGAQPYSTFETALNSLLG